MIRVRSNTIRNAASLARKWLGLTLQGHRTFHTTQLEADPVSGASRYRILLQSGELVEAQIRPLARGESSAVWGGALGWVEIL